jgi:hypothetical protein
VVRHGQARFSLAGFGVTRRGEVRHSSMAWCGPGRVRRGRVGHGEARRGNVRLSSKVGQRMVVFGEVSQGTVR